MTKRIRPAFAVVIALAVGGCSGKHLQSALHPGSGEAREISQLWWVMLAVYGAVFLITMGLLALALRRGGGASDGGETRAGPPGGGTRFVVVAGMVIPAAILLGMLVYSLIVSVALRFPETDLTIRVTGHQWWWEVEYPELGIVTANEIHVPAGKAVRVELVSADVIHSFWVPNLHGKMDLLPEKMNAIWLRAEGPGVFRGQCAEFCGLQHALMAFEVVALAEGEFDDWVSRMQIPRPEAMEVGQRIFVSAGCNNCHGVRGLSEAEGIGPDLTHLARRRTLGAGTAPNTREHLEGWVANPQEMKPGNFMPATHLEPAEMHALLDFLETLR